VHILELQPLPYLWYRSIITRPTLPDFGLVELLVLVAPWFE
jgi:hypothetical protein